MLGLQVVSILLLAVLVAGQYQLLSHKVTRPRPRTPSRAQHGTPRYRFQPVPCSV